MEWFGYDRLYKTLNCPYCSGELPIPGKTSFKALYPDLMKDWKKINNVFVDADLVTENYDQNVWWKCSTCHSSYEMSIKARVIYYKRNQESCGYCKGYRRRFYNIIKIKHNKLFKRNVMFYFFLILNNK